jgi:F0F1-type ATP synthase delta subunit
MKLRAGQLARVYVEMTEGKSQKDVEKIAAAFVEFLVARHERSQWRDVVRHIDGAWRKKYGVATVSITSAHPLSKEARNILEKAAMGATLTETVDAALIGGARVRMDDRVIDASIAGSLLSLASHLTA